MRPIAIEPCFEHGNRTDATGKSHVTLLFQAEKAGEDAVLAMQQPMEKRGGFIQRFTSAATDDKFMTILSILSTQKFGWQNRDADSSICS